MSPSDAISTSGVIIARPGEIVDFGEESGASDDEAWGRICTWEKRRGEEENRLSLKPYLGSIISPHSSLEITLFSGR